ncbi:uncharacterized protein L3040_006012 [Drepanopeziza brunnea f. sp. 'multigermtubi']|uniref:uncharacterized protein n=1 Tax=Drepanopeziza brunnea f. sp. 'multigermtubi' TaxID=698441 RepID=UPI002398EC95|nr:hypothetical protein L3040_006012 [Drepanopeziza brunnea f. sp. 'multigermtubi']
MPPITTALVQSRPLFDPNPNTVVASLILSKPLYHKCRISDHLILVFLWGRHMGIFTRSQLEKLSSVFTSKDAFTRHIRKHEGNPARAPDGTIMEIDGVGYSGNTREPVGPWDFENVRDCGGYSEWRAGLERTLEDALREGVKSEDFNTPCPGREELEQANALEPQWGPNGKPMPYVVRKGLIDQRDGIKDKIGSFLAYVDKEVKTEQGREKVHQMFRDALKGVLDGKRNKEFRGVLGGMMTKILERVQGFLEFLDERVENEPVKQQKFGELRGIIDRAFQDKDKEKRKLEGGVTSSEALRKRAKVFEETPVERISMNTRQSTKMAAYFGGLKAGQIPVADRPKSRSEASAERSRQTRVTMGLSKPAAPAPAMNSSEGQGDNVEDDDELLENQLTDSTKFWTAMEDQDTQNDTYSIRNSPKQILRPSARIVEEVIDYEEDMLEAQVTGNISLHRAVEYQRGEGEDDNGPRDTHTVHKNTEVGEEQEQEQQEQVDVLSSSADEEIARLRAEFSRFYSPELPFNPQPLTTSRVRSFNSKEEPVEEEPVEEDRSVREESESLFLPPSIKHEPNESEAVFPSPNIKNEPDESETFTQRNPIPMRTTGSGGIYLQSEVPVEDGIKKEPAEVAYQTARHSPPPSSHRSQAERKATDRRPGDDKDDGIQPDVVEVVYSFTRHAPPFSSSNTQIRTRRTATMDLYSNEDRSYDVESEPSRVSAHRLRQATTFPSPKTKTRSKRHGERKVINLDPPSDSDFEIKIEEPGVFRHKSASMPKRKRRSKVINLESGAGEDSGDDGVKVCSRQEWLQGVRKKPRGGGGGGGGGGGRSRYGHVHAYH